MVFVTNDIANAVKKPCYSVPETQTVLVCFGALHTFVPTDRVSELMWTLLYDGFYPIYGTCFSSRRSFLLISTL